MTIYESLWEIECDGWYPYCPDCYYEPSRDEGLPEICPKCGKNMRKPDKKLQKQT